MSWLIGKLVNQPVIVGNVVKAAVGLLAIFGVAVTDATTEAVVGVVMAVLALVAAITGAEQARVTPVKKTARLLEQPVEAVNDLLRGVKL